jgi:acyl-CoA synthetase (AMP-forming)/AMP-acid ligase II
MLEHQLTAGSGSTFFLLSLLEHPDFTEEHARLMPAIGLGGSAVPAAIGERAAGLGIETARSYGSTEHPSTTGATHQAPRDKRITTDGQALPGVELRLDEDGEIWSRGPDLFAGYTDPVLTDEATDVDGWYRTGDIGELDDDGWLTITDRAKDIIIRGGENVSPAEVEDLLLRLDGVAEVAVVAAPDERLGEHGCAFVRPAPGAAAPSLEEIRAHLAAAGLARQKWPEEVREVADLPRTPSGKVKKFALRDQLRRSAQ